MRRQAAAVRAELERLPRAIWVLALVAVINALCWAALTPAYWVPDEPAHAGYAQRIAETGALPDLDATAPKIGLVAGSQEQRTVYDALPFGVEGQPSWSETKDRTLDSQLTDGPPLNRTRPRQALNATGNPPLYYLLQAIPYRAAYGAGYLDRLMAMRAFSTLFAGLTVFFGFLFLRQLLPGRPWAWTVGSAALAFQPMLGFMSGGVNNDGLLYALGAALLWGVARAFRRGLTPSTGALIGVVLALGLLTKSTMIGLVPGLTVAVVALVLRDRDRRSALKGALTLAFVSGAPFAAWLVLRARITGESAAPAGGVVSASAAGGLEGLRGMVSYLWQAALPRLPFMEDQFPYFAPWFVYFQGFIGRFGWFQFGFSTLWYWIALGVFAALAVLAARALLAHRAALRARWPEAATYLALLAGLFLSVEVAAFGYKDSTGIFFEQARYLFPVLALYGAFVALAVIGCGRRWEKAAGVTVAILAVGHSLFSQLLTIDRFYLGAPY